MKKIIFTGLLSILALTQTQAHVWDELAILARPDNNSTFALEKYCFIQPTTYTNAVFFDYNNDGNLDLLLMGQGGDWNISGDIKFVILYRNLGPEENFRFEKVADSGFSQRRDEGFYNPISTGDFNHDGYTDVLLMSFDNERHVDLYLNDQGSGKFIRQEIGFEAVSNGSVMFGDLNNDGWLDIVYSGYSDKTPAVLKTYTNQKDGKFSDQTPDNMYGVYQGQSTLADINGDGLLDIICGGNGNDGNRTTSIHYNSTAQSSQLAFRSISGTECGILPVINANPLAADFNADGLTDLIINGEANDGSGYRTRIYYQDKTGNFTMDTSYPIVPVNQDGGINMGDWNGDGNMDIIAGGYIGQLDAGAPACYSSPLRVYENQPEKNGLKGNTPPTAPDNVSAFTEDGDIIINWNDGTDTETPESALRYNLFVQNKTTGETYTMIPADLETGKLKVGNDLQTSLSSAVKNYRIKAFGKGEYTIGVQTLDQAYAGSKFKTINLSVTTGVKESTANTGLQVTNNGMNVDIKCDSQETVCIYSTDGQLVATGQTNETFILPGKGVYLIAAGPYREKTLLK